MKKVVLTLSAVVAVAFGVQAQTGAKTKETTTANAKTTTTAVAPKTVTSKEVPAASKEAQTSVVPAKDATTTTDFVKFDKIVHDYGTVKKGADGNCEFVYKNTGSTPLVITSCYGSCGCTVPNWPKEPLMPGKTLSIKVHYDTNRTGPFEKTVTVNYQDHAQPVVLKIKGAVEAPPADVPFGSQPANSGAPLERNN